jgi:hypothetical protein
MKCWAGKQWEGKHQKGRMSYRVHRLDVLFMEVVDVGVS